jgi:hypothetical protein
MDAVYKIILTDEYGDVSYAKRKSELGSWLAGINFDVVTRVDVELLDPKQANTPYIQNLLMDQGGPWTPLGVVAEGGLK